MIMKPQPATIVNNIGLRALSFGVLIAALAICGCKKETSSKNSAPTTSTELKKVKIGYVGLTCDADLFVAFEKGFFKDEGLDAELLKFPWAELSTGLALGKVDATHHLV